MRNKLLTSATMQKGRYRMPKCPYCGKEIDELTNWCSEQVPYVAFLDEGVLDYRSSSLEPEPIPESDEYYACPECGETICYLPERAIAFLRGDEKWVILEEGSS